MRKILIIAILFLSLLLPASPVLAIDPDSGTVTVVAVPYLGDGLSSFTATIINDYEVLLEWLAGVDYDRIMVRAKYGSMPTDIADIFTAPTDGYLVYYGTDLSASDTSVDFFNNPGPIFYRAWVQKADDTWLLGDDIESEVSGGLIAIFLGMLALGTTGLSFWKRNIVLSLGSSLSWTALAVLLISDPETIQVSGLDESWVLVLAFLFISMAIGCALWYIAGIGKTKITMVDSSGKSWAMWGKAPSDKDIPRDRLVKQKHKERLKAIRSRRR